MAKPFGGLDNHLHVFDSGPVFERRTAREVGILDISRVERASDMEEVRVRPSQIGHQDRVSFIRYENHDSTTERMHFRGNRQLRQGRIPIQYKLLDGPASEVAT